MGEPCKFGCSRERLIGELVTYQCATGDGCDMLMASIRIMQEAGVDARHIAMLMRVHEALCRVYADDANALFDMIGPQPGTHRPFDPIAWLAEDNARNNQPSPQAAP
ncbi:MAG: hypothetical protein HXY30_17260 [Pseudorhodoplanes sp.]|nr:hypothetical protein [Pseudorhodoplanes sp.]